jgi:hypothetical protein
MDALTEPVLFPTHSMRHLRCETENNDPQHKNERCFSPTNFKMTNSTLGAPKLFRFKHLAEKKIDSLGAHRS